MIFIANIFSFIGMCLLAYSTFAKNKKNMLYVQVGDCIFNSLGDLFVGSFSAMSTNLICAVRNILNAKKKNSVIANTIIIALITSIGLIVNTKGIIGLLPIVASIQYTICSYKVKTAQGLRYGLTINLILWLIHDCFVMLYPSVLADTVLIIITVCNIVKNKNNNELEKENSVN